ncbi:hypothetical protein BDM02DRAFT_2819645 [Thelephora ganbajun]|uniref:Uncharacterized protein n=1 Tax=Thelephora ganbajun TaxID=370292 RepID=A0ACB6ZBI9_THEGA|nr:hypothetical protein BDM02DRAFT_2819645 [Thelephora ganbajun]
MMDIVKSVREHISGWTSGGEISCRQLFLKLHSASPNGQGSDDVYTAYNTLLTATLSSWSKHKHFTPATFVTFVQSVLSSLPSTSSSITEPSSLTWLGSSLVDMVWSIDIELDESVAESKSSEGTSGIEHQKNREKDKQVVADLVKRLLAAGIVQPSPCRERLDSGLVYAAGLSFDKSYWDKREVRTRTSLFYKQNKVNLLREQTEGYSKLVTEITSSVGPPHSPATGLPVESVEAIYERASSVWGRVVSLIGHFDLDPNRALDVFLDVFATHLATQYAFFLALLSLSPWAPTISSEAPPSSSGGTRFDDVLANAEILSDSAPSDLNKPNDVLAQVLGFKFAHYDHPETTDSTPMNLYFLAALLIREGYLSLEALFPHLSPDDEGMEQVHRDYLAKVESRIAGAKISQLAMAAPLESVNSASKPKVTTPSAPKPAEVKEKSNQKVGIASALLSIGAIRPALSLITTYPWIVDANPQLADLIIRIMKHSIASLYESTLVTKERPTGFMQPKTRYGVAGLQPAPARRPHLTFWAPTPPSTSVWDFAFFFPKWTERVPVCTQLSDLVDFVEPFMRFITVHISRDPLFVTKFLRLGRHHLATTVPIDPETKKPTGLPDPENPIRQFWLKVLRLHMLPALCLIRGNAVCTVEVWNMIRQYDTTVRWRLYGEWKTKTYKSHPELRVRAVQVDREAKGILRRLSHNTIDSLAGPVAKLAHSNPCIFFGNAVNQIMAYDNLAGVVIQVLKYSTNMSFDVLVFVILDALANPNKERVKDDGVNTSDWLQSLASFTGMLFRRYSADLTPVIKYVVHQLYNGQTTEIIVLRELIWKMVGIEPLPSLSDAQIGAMAGGPTLRIEAVASSTRGARLDPSEVTLRGPQRLGKTLLDSSLALPLLIQVAQQRQSCVFTAQDTHLKSLASLYDATHGVLLQYLELLTSPDVISAEDYNNKILPSLADLGELYGISAPICMQIIRPKLNEVLLNAALAKAEQERAASEEEERRLKAKLTAKREPSVNPSRVASPVVSGTITEQPIKDLTPTAEEPQDAVMDSVESSTPKPEEPQWLPQLAALFDDVKKIAPPGVIEAIGPAFYLTFWQLSTYDLSPPGARYDEEQAALRTLSRQEDGKYSAAERSADRSVRGTATAHRQRRDRYSSYVHKLAQEYKNQATVRAFTIKRLQQEKNHWFAGNTKAAALINALIEYCFQPRCVLSPMDADFCVQFVRVMHLQGTPGFWTLTCYDRLLGDHVKNIVFSCSEYEARNYGRFLLGLLTDLLKWHQDEQQYLQDNRVKGAGKAAYLPGLQLRWTNKPTVAISDLAKWSEVQQFNRKCHRKLAKALIDCIETGEFMHVYNAIIVLKEVLPVFPVAAASGTAGYSLVTVLDRLLEKEERGDLKILARAYHASLKKRESIWAIPTDHKSGHVPMKVDSPARTSTPTGSGQDSRSAGQGANPPSAPRSHMSSVNNGIVAPVQPKANQPLGSTKTAMESVPRPDFIKRVGRGDKMDTTPDHPSTPEVNKSGTPQPTREPPTGPAKPTPPTQPRRASPVNAVDARKDLTYVRDQSLPPSPSNAIYPSSAKDPPHSPRGHRGPDERRESPQSAMPPPTIPSQKPSAHELRETAKMTMGSRLPEKPDMDKSSSQHDRNGHPPRRRSTSPSRPGTRNPSVDSRGSAGQSRSAGEDERRESRSGPSRRESARLERSARDRPSGRDGRESDREDRERERERDRHGERERKDRDRNERDKDREREKERERERDRDRNGGRDSRDRHRRDERDRKERPAARESAREQRESARESTTATPATPVETPTRPSDTPSRHRSTTKGEDGLGKRRRPADDDPDRASKRSSRKDGSHHEDRSRRGGGGSGGGTEGPTNERPREPERRRRGEKEPEEKVRVYSQMIILSLI